MGGQRPSFKHLPPVWTRVHETDVTGDTRRSIFADGAEPHLTSCAAKLVSSELVWNVLLGEEIRGQERNSYLFRRLQYSPPLEGEMGRYTQGTLFFRPAIIPSDRKNIRERTLHQKKIKEFHPQHFPWHPGRHYYDDPGSNNIALRLDGSLSARLWPLCTINPVPSIICLPAQWAYYTPLMVPLRRDTGTNPAK